MGIVPILNTIQDAYGQGGGDNRFGPHKDWPGDKNQGGRNDPPFKHNR